MSHRQYLPIASTCKTASDSDTGTFRLVKQSLLRSNEVDPSKPECPPLTGEIRIARPSRVTVNPNCSKMGVVHLFLVQLRLQRFQSLYGINRLFMLRA